MCESRNRVILVFDKAAAAPCNRLSLDESGMGCISALPWNQAPREFREMPLEQLTALSSAQPGVQACKISWCMEKSGCACLF
jgi:hypothetical protein